MNFFRFFKKTIRYFNLESDLDSFDKIHASIQNDIEFKGTNLWILVLAILVASVGLNVNSTAVIIGAMLISPLMGPINGVGYSIATYDFALFRRALNNFLFAVVASLITSTIYFMISPISTAYSELLARTSPTIYDVLIAFFGGTAGIVAMSSRYKGNVIPGVAIATALMPPLCTAGYGLATMQMNYFGGALYLFTINTVFIAISALVISRILKFPIRAVLVPKQKKRVTSWIYGIIAIVILPSIYFGYKLVQQEKFNKNATKFVNNISIYEGNYLLNYEINSSAEHIVLVYGGSKLKDSQKENISNKAKDFSIESATIEFKEGLLVDELNNQMNSEVTNLKNEIHRLTDIIKHKDEQLQHVHSYKDLAALMLKEIQVYYPDITDCSYTATFDIEDSTTLVKKDNIVVFTSKKADILRRDKELFTKWLQERLQQKSVRVFFENNESK